MTTVQISLPDAVKRKVSRIASQQHVTLQELMTMALMEKLSTIPDPRLERRAAHGKREDFDAVLNMIPDVPPAAEDRLE